MMERLLRPFRGLAWKLTLSYTLVTVAALLVVEMSLMFVAVFFVTNESQLPARVAQMLAATSPQVAPYLAGPAPDVASLNQWLSLASTNGLETTDPQAGVTSVNLAQFYGNSGSMKVVDAQGVLLAAAPVVPVAQLNRQLDMDPALQPLLARALDGEGDYRQTMVMTKANELIVVAPIKAQDGRVLGALIFRGVLLPLDQPQNRIWDVFWRSALLLTLAAGSVGTLFGFLTSRGLTRRLRRVSAAADAWSHGDFSVTARDSAPDEIGQLARRLNRMAEQLENLLHTREQLATVEERNRLARELHDSVKQQVFATAMQVGAARELVESDPQAAAGHLEQAEQLARQAQAELSGLIRELRPATLQDRGLGEALRTYVAGWSQQSGIPAEVTLAGERRLPLNVEQALYRVAQEALANVVKHSQARHARLHLEWSDAAITLTVADDGCGFDPLKTPAGVGLYSMRERLQALGGALEIKSTSDQGTEIIAMVNL